MDEQAEGEFVIGGTGVTFTQLQTFFRDLTRQFGIARLPYTQYAVERLELCEVTLDRLLGQISMALNSDSDSLNAENSASGHGVVLHPLMVS